MWASHGTCSCIDMCVSTIANSVMLQLYLWYDFNRRGFKIKHKLYLYRVSGSPKYYIAESHITVTLQPILPLLVVIVITATSNTTNYYYFYYY